MTLLERTDGALYAAKDLGRNRVEWAKSRFKPAPGLAPARKKASPAPQGERADYTIRSSCQQTAM